MTDPRIVAALREATGETLAELATLHTELADLLDASAWPNDPNPNAKLARLHRIAAGLALAVAEMQERAARHTRVAKWDPANVAWRIDSDGEATWLDGQTYDQYPQTLMSALAALLGGGR